MGYVYVYGPDDEDLESTGLCGALMPSSCVHDEEAGGVSAVTMRHPYDEYGKWKHLVERNIIACECRVRTPPDLRPNGAYAASVEEWTVLSGGLTKSQKQVWSKAKKGKKVGTLINGRTVYVLETAEERYKVQFEKGKYNKKKKITTYTWKTGWCDPEAIRFNRTVTIASDTNGILQVCGNGDSRTQYFRIQSVNRDVGAQEIEVYAVHISFDLNDNLLNWKTTGTVTGLEAAAAIEENLDFDSDIEILTDVNDSWSGGIDWQDVNPMSAITDPETGFLSVFGAELLRDNETLYLLHDVDSGQGFRIEHRKNLIGASLKVNLDGMITAVKPRGEKANGDPLYLTDDAGSQRNYVFSSARSTYGTKAELLSVSEAKVDKKKGVTEAIARERMRAEAQKRFDEEEADKPSIELDVNFVELGKTTQFARYRALEAAYLYDSAVVAAPEYGIEVTAKVTKLSWDCLDERITKMTLGEVERGSRIYSWQVAGSISGDKLLRGSVQASALSDDAGVYKVVVRSSTGNEVADETVLSAAVYYGSEDVTDEIAASRFTWYAGDDVAAEGVKTLTVSRDSLDGAVVYACEIAEE